MPGKGKLVITGLLEKGMEESAQAAMSYIRSRGGALGLEPDFYQKVDVHVHFPEFVRKDGPSAGVTMATSIASALMKIPVRNDVAMTGEITLRGRVMPIGGLKEKLLAAHRAGITTVLDPEGEPQGPARDPAPRAARRCASCSSSTWTRCCARRSACPIRTAVRPAQAARGVPFWGALRRRRRSPEERAAQAGRRSAACATRAFVDGTPRGARRSWVPGSRAPSVSLPPCVGWGCLCRVDEAIASRLCLVWGPLPRSSRPWSRGSLHGVRNWASTKCDAGDE